MAINVQYGPIGTALGLAAQAGAGVRNQRVGQQDLEFLRLMQEAQANADKDYSNQIQQGLYAQNANAQNSLKAEGLKADQAQQAALMAAQKTQQDRAFTLQANNTQVDNQRQQQEFDFRQKTQQATLDQKTGTQASQQAYLQSLPDGPTKDAAIAYFTASGKLPETVIPQNPAAGGSNLSPEYRMLDAEYRRQERTLAAQKKAIAALTYSDDKLAPQSKSVPGAIAGQEPQYQQLAQQIAQTQTQMDRVGQALDSQSSGFGDVTPPNQQVLNGIIQQVQAQRSPQGAGGKPVQVNSKAEYDALPSGTPFVWGPSGQTAVKR